MKKILLALFLTICAFLLFLPAAKAEVYGYDLTVLGKIGSSNVKNGSNVDRLALGNDLVVTLRVIDPANSNNSPKVTSWEINVLSYSADGKAILSTVNGYWSYTASSSNNINNLTLRLNSVSGIKIDDYSVVVTAVATVGSRKTNSIRYKLTVNDPAEIIVNLNTNSINTNSVPENDNSNIDTPLTIVNSNADDYMAPEIVETNVNFDLVREIPASIANYSANIVKSFSNFVGVKDHVAKTVYSVGTAVTAFAAIQVASLANVSTLFSASELIHTYWYALVSFLGVRRKKNRWGRVVEAGTGLPLPSVKVSLISINEVGFQKVAAIYYTDKDGSYGFVVAPGKYRVSVSKDNFHPVDLGMDYYSGQVLEVKNYKEGLVVSNIAMIMNEETVKKHFYRARNLAVTEKIISVFSFLLLGFGSILAIDTLFKDNTGASWIFAVIYLALWMFSVKNLIKKSPWSSVRDKGDKKPISLAIVRIMDETGKKLVRTVVTNQDGRFSALLGKGKYGVLVAKQGFYQSKPINFDTKDKMNTMNQNIELEKKPTSGE